MLTLARQGATIDETEVVRLDSTAQKAWTNVDTVDATLEIAADGAIEADQSRLVQLFENLYRNAIEHGGKAVTVTVGRLNAGFYIEDTGPEIPAETYDEIFENGYATNKDGTGFGLPIVKRVAEAHEWEITATEGSMGGARFEITGVEFSP